ncbi:MAG: hypothetical protein J07HQW2_03008 [Haloquadratum walsbyi J07HQW2]|uniref:Uncharacterized protein n=1 Tax=Haloquadratum walsbyi J07HQW2 TaxID=1238425 RepID=U1NI15_9EURY|nr:MAG: hypothetical protein J07HQW2_03008 [Haloquadratum walsbyi J07HQW2]
MFEGTLSNAGTLQIECYSVYMLEDMNNTVTEEELGLGQSEYSGNTMSVEAGIPEGSHHRDGLLSDTALP